MEAGGVRSSQTRDPGSQPRRVAGSRELEAGSIAGDL